MSRSLAEVAEGAWWAGVRAADPERATLEALSRSPPPPGAVTVVALGKAATGMARGAAAALGSRLCDGIALIPHGAEPPEVPGLLVLRGAHPIPDAHGAAAAAEIGALVDRLGQGQVLLALISGGGSALLADPAPPLTLAGLREHTEEWLASGAPIEALNAWRIAHATLKGGRMAARAAPAAVHTLVLSDVPGHPELVASGPTAGRGPLVEIGGLHTAVDGARRWLEERGWPVEQGPMLGGEARVTGEALGRTLAGPGARRALVWGGECTVTVRGPGRGGRCQELALAAALELAGSPALLLAAGTDGRDGPTDAAGAVVDGRTAARPGGGEALERNDSYPWLSAAGALLHPGPTGTNVGDLVIGLVP